MLATTLVVRRAKAPKMTLEKRMLMVCFGWGGRVDGRLLIGGLGWLKAGLVKGWAGAVGILAVLALLDGYDLNGDEALLIHFTSASKS